MAKQSRSRSMGVGVVTRHTRNCALSSGGKRCSCVPTYQARVPLGERGKRETRCFASFGEASEWRSKRLLGLHRRAQVVHTNVTVGEELDSLITGMQDGSVRTKRGEPYKPSVVVAYRLSATRHLKPAIGAYRLIDLERRRIQQLVEDLAATGMSGQTIRNTLMPLRVVVRRALRDDRLSVSPVSHLELPAPAGFRDRAATREEVPMLLEALSRPSDGMRGLRPSEHALVDQAAWSLMFYAGLRIGEAQGLRWCDIDFTTPQLCVEQAWDDATGQIIAPKSRKSRRSIPMAAPLVNTLAALRASRADDGPPTLVLRSNRTRTRPISQQILRRRARRAWEAAGVQGYTPHEARHTFGSLAAAAGISLWDVAEMMGHSDPSITAARYRHAFSTERARWGQTLDLFLNE